MSRLSVVRAAEYEYIYQEAETEKEHIDIKDEYYEDQDICSSNKKGNVMMETNWVPHPRTGIYFPEGHEWVMKDVSEDASSLGQSQSYWLRNIDGVESHHPDIHSADDYFLTPNH